MAQPFGLRIREYQVATAGSTVGTVAFTNNCYGFTLFNMTSDDAVWLSLDGATYNLVLNKLGDTGDLYKPPSCSHASPVWKAIYVKGNNGTQTGTCLVVAWESAL